MDEWKEVGKAWKEAGKAWKRVPDEMANGVVIGGFIGSVVGFAIVIIMYITRYHP